jgi:cytochrome c biogenesis protein CcdA
MGLIAWTILLAGAAALATAAQYLFFRQDRRPTDYDWVYIAGGALLGGFTAHIWYPGWGPVVDGLNLLPALLGALALGAAAELVYRRILRPRHLA